MLIDLLESDSDAINVALRAEGAYRLAALRLEKGQWADAIKYADISLASYESLANQEHRLAWGHQLLALAYQGQEKKRKAASHLQEKDRLLQVWGTDRDRLRNVLSSILATREDAGQQTALVEAEKIANALDVDARIDLYVVAAVSETQRGHGELGLDYLQEALLLEQGVTQWHDKQTPVYLHYAAGQLLFDHGKLSEAHTHATRAFALDAGNEGIVVLLAEIQLNLGLYSELEETLKALRNLGAQGNLYATLFNALSKVRRGDFAVAARLFGDGYRQTGGPNWKVFRDECLDTANGVISPENGPRLAQLWRQGRQPSDEQRQDPMVLVPHPRLPNVRFYSKVVKLCVGWVLSNQDVAPTFVRSFLMRQTKSLKEEDFRNLFQQMAATHFPEARGEESRPLGRSDLLLPSNGKLRRRVRFEFKVWGRNDYAGVVDQLIGYMTDQEDIGVVYMVNPNKSDIAQIYRHVVVYEQPSYVSGSLRERPVRPDVVDLPHFLSIHLSPRGRRVTIYHIVHNLWT